jgi:hypothetical protein
MNRTSFIMYRPAAVGLLPVATGGDGRRATVGRLLLGGSLRNGALPYPFCCAPAKVRAKRWCKSCRGQRF